MKYILNVFIIWKLLLAVTLWSRKECESSDILMEMEDLDFEVFIAKRQLSFTCGLILLMQESLVLNFKAPTRPTYIYAVSESHLSPDIKDLKLTENCNIVVILGVENSERLATYDSFVEENFWRINLILIYPLRLFKLEDLKSLPLETIWYKHLMLVGSDGRIIGEVGNGNCLYEEPDCFLKEKPLKVGFTDVEPYLRVKGWSPYLSEKIQYPTTNLNKSLRDDELEIIDGVEGQFLRYLVTEYDMKVTLIAPTEMEYGYKDESGNWTGKFGLLARGEVDLVAGMIPGNYKRLEIGKYLAHLYNSKFTLTSRHAVPQVGWFGPFRPFSSTIWALLLGSVIVVGIPIFWITEIHSKVTRASSNQNKTGLVIFRELIKLLIDQPLLRTPEGPAALVIASWLLFALIFQSIYSSNLTARLSVPDKIKQVRTMEDVWDLQRTLVVYKSGTVALYINMSTDPKVKLVNKKLVLYTANIANYTVAVHDDYRLVSTMDKGIFKSRIEKLGRNPSDYHYSKVPLINVFCSWLTSKHLRVGPALTTAILRADATGLMEKWFTDRLKPDGNKTISADEEICVRSEGFHPEDATLMLSNLKGVFLLWSLGVFFSSLVFVIELLIPKRSNQVINFGYLE